MNGRGRAAAAAVGLAVALVGLAAQEPPPTRRIPAAAPNAAPGVSDADVTEAAGLAGFRPYVGAGVNYTHFSSVDLPEGVSIDRDSVGPALGAGADVPLGQGWLLNFDAKRVWLGTEVRAGGQNLGDFGVDPWLLSVGVGRRF